MDETIALISLLICIATRMKINETNKRKNILPHAFSWCNICVVVFSVYKIGNILFYKIRNLTYYYDVMIIDVTSNKKILYEKKSTDIEENQKAGETFYWQTQAWFCMI